MTDMNQTAWGLPDPELHAEIYADVPVKRAIAWVVDVFLIFLLTLPVILFTLTAALFVYPAVWLLVSFVYRVVTITSGSATLGMRLMSLELRTWRGERFGFGEALMHTGLYLVCMSFFFLPQIISAVLMMTTARAQGLHDLALGTAAINRSR